MDHAPLTHTYMKVEPCRQDACSDPSPLAYATAESPRRGGTPRTLNPLTLCDAPGGVPTRRRETEGSTTCHPRGGKLRLRPCFSLTATPPTDMRTDNHSVSSLEHQQETCNHSPARDSRSGWSPKAGSRQRPLTVGLCLRWSPHKGGESQSGPVTPHHQQELQVESPQGGGKQEAAHGYPRGTSNACSERPLYRTPPRPTPCPRRGYMPTPRANNT